jgi:adenylate cyclase
VSATGVSPDLAGKAAGGRRLIAVVYADMVGYSRLISLDDAGTLRRLRTLRRALIDPAIREYGGKVVQTGGDSLLVAFDSIDGAVRCAVKVQQQVPVYGSDQLPDRRIRFRIGIEIGDAIAHATDLHGEAVNIAARLQTQCPVGGVCVSSAVRDHVHGRLHLPFEAIGPLSLKNIARPVEAFVLRLDPAAEASQKLEPSRSSLLLAAVRRSLTGARIAGGLLLVAILASGGWWLLHNKASAPAVSTVVPTASRPTAHSPEDRRMSIIVLPFENSSGDPEQDSVAAGITRDVTNRLALNPYDPLIPATTSAIYRGKTVDLRKVGRDYNVHFALTGDARRQDGHLIVSAILYETDDDRAIWSQRFDRPDRGDEWNGVIRFITAGINSAKTDSEVARAQREHPSSLDKRDLLLASMASSISSETKQNYLAQIALVERALAIDPGYVPALDRKAQLFAILAADGFSSDSVADLATASKAADRALQLAPNSATALTRKALVLRVQGNFDGAAALFRKLIELDPQDGYKYRQLGQIQMAQGRYKEALENFIIAKQLRGAETNPLIDQDLASALLATDRFPEAVAQAQLAIAEWTSEAGRQAEVPWLVLIAAESENGQTEAARTDLRKFLATPRTHRSITQVQKHPHFARNSNLLKGLRDAGMPEE